MLKQEAVAVLMAGKGSQLEALERVCDKRYLRACKSGMSDIEANKAVVKHLDEYISRWNKPESEHIAKSARVLIAYWIARQC